MKPNLRKAHTDNAILPNTISIRFDGVESQQLVIALDLQGLAVSGGSACQSGTVEPSHVLHAMGLSNERIHGSVRFGLGRFTTEEEIVYTIDTVSQVVRKLQQASPLYALQASPQGT